MGEPGKWGIAVDHFPEMVEDTKSNPQRASLSEEN
jgi:hypothetical protein